MMAPFRVHRHIKPKGNRRLPDLSVLQKTQLKMKINPMLELVLGVPAVRIALIRENPLSKLVLVCCNTVKEKSERI